MWYTSGMNIQITLQIPLPEGAEYALPQTIQVITDPDVVRAAIATIIKMEAAKDALDRTNTAMDKMIDSLSKIPIVGSKTGGIGSANNTGGFGGR